MNNHYETPEPDDIDEFEPRQSLTGQVVSSIILLLLLVGFAILVINL